VKVTPAKATCRVRNKVGEAKDSKSSVASMGAAAREADLESKTMSPAVADWMCAAGRLKRTRSAVRAIRVDDMEPPFERVPLSVRLDRHGSPFFLGTFKIPSRVVDLATTVHRADGVDRRGHGRSPQPLSSFPLFMVELD